MGTPETSCEPCPDRILDDVGCLFGMGAVGGSAFYFMKGIYNSPKGSRLIGGTQAVRKNAPRVGGRFAVWGGLFSIFDCTMVYVRQKEDPWNSIISGAATGGFLSMRKGLVAASRSAVFCGLLLALLEGAEIMQNNGMSAQQQQQQKPPVGIGATAGIQLPNVGAPKEVATPAASTLSSSPSWLRGLFGGYMKERGGAKPKTEILESF